MRKIRLYKGPLSGKVMEHPNAGANELIVRGGKKLSRREKYEFEVAHYQNHFVYGQPVRYPMIEARYRLVMRAVPAGGGFANVVCTHPDGSLFYEYVEGTKREF